MTTPSVERVADPQMSDEAIRRGTGRDWAAWTEALDAWGAMDQDHAAIARHVEHDHGVDGWWAQAVTVGYERIRGLRKVNERPDGFSMNASKTVAVPFDLFVDDAKRAEWLGDGVLTVRTAKAPKSARFDVSEGGILAAHFLDKGEKSAVQLQLNGIASEAELAERRRSGRRVSPSSPGTSRPRSAGLLPARPLAGSQRSLFPAVVRGHPGRRPEGPESNRSARTAKPRSKAVVR